MNVDQKSIETKVFSIVICRPTGNKWQSKTLLLSIFDPRSSIVVYVFDCRLPGVLTLLEFLFSANIGELWFKFQKTETKAHQILQTFEDCIWF